MLLRFACSNFRSIKGRQELSFMAAPEFDEHKDSLIHLPSLDEHVLPVVAIYGANASGKSNILEALRFLIKAVDDSQGVWKPRQPIPRVPFKLDPAMSGEPSTFDVDILVEGVRYHYGFECTVARIEREWLIAFPEGEEQLWFEREHGKDIVFGDDFQGTRSLLQQMVRDNSLVLSAAMVANEKSVMPIALDLIMGNKFAQGSGFPVETVLLSFIKSGNNQISELLGLADSSIDGFKVVASDLSEKKKIDAIDLPGSVITAIGMKGVEKEKLIDFIDDFFSKDFKFEFDRKSAGDKAISFDSSEESQGTRRLFELAGPVTSALRRGSTLIVDELDASLHTLIACSLVRLFSNRETNPHGAQLLFTTHDTNLLDADLLRRDEVWFTEKDKEGATHLYPLSDIKVPDGSDLEKGYLEGRFGAIPYIGNLARRFGKGA